MIVGGHKQKVKLPSKDRWPNPTTSGLLWSLNVACPLLRSSFEFSCKKLHVLKYVLKRDVEGCKRNIIAGLVVSEWEHKVGINP